MKIAFEALIKDVNNKSLVSGDKQTRVVLDFLSTHATELIQTLDELHKPDQFVMVVIMDKDEAERSLKND